MIEVREITKLCMSMQVCGVLKILIRTIDWSVELQDKPGETLPALAHLCYSESPA